MTIRKLIGWTILLLLGLGYFAFLIAMTEWKFVAMMFIICSCITALIAFACYLIDNNE